MTFSKPQPDFQININREVCIGAAACVAAAGKSFELDAEGKSSLLSPAEDTQEALQQAAMACPTRAIRLRST